jgi:hypothetical protein
MIVQTVGNPLGLVSDVVPFDINPARLNPSASNTATHFEQVYENALEAMENARAVFDYANDIKNKRFNNYKLLLDKNQRLIFANLLEIHNDLKLTQQQNEQRIIQMNGLLAQLEARIIDNKYTKNNTELISLISSLNELIQECQTDNK